MTTTEPTAAARWTGETKMLVRRHIASAAAAMARDSAPYDVSIKRAERLLAALADAGLLAAASGRLAPASTPDPRAVIARALDEHRWTKQGWDYVCTCGQWKRPAADDEARELWEAHRADAIVAALGLDQPAGSPDDALALITAAIRDENDGIEDDERAIAAARAMAAEVQRLTADLQAERDGWFNTRKLLHAAITERDEARQALRDRGQRLAQALALPDKLRFEDMAAMVEDLRRHRDIADTELDRLSEFTGPLAEEDETPVDTALRVARERGEWGVEMRAKRDKLRAEVTRVADDMRTKHALLSRSGVFDFGRIADRLDAAVEASATPATWPDNYQPDHPHVAEIRDAAKALAGLWDAWLHATTVQPTEEQIAAGYAEVLDLDSSRRMEAAVEAVAPHADAIRDLLADGTPAPTEPTAQRCTHTDRDLWTNQPIRCTLAAHDRGTSHRMAYEPTPGVPTTAPPAPDTPPTTETGA